MGCVLCKESTGDKRKHNNPDEPPPADLRNTEDLPSSSSTTTAAISVEIGEKKKKDLDSIQIQPERRTWHTGDFSAGSSRRPGMSLRTPEGWPPWLIAACGDSIKDLTPRRATTYEKLEKIGQGTYSNVYKAKDLLSGKIVALKKVRFDNLEAESVKFMAREILVLRRLNHPNVIKLQGLVTSRVSCSLYLVFEYMEHDLSGLAATQGLKFDLPQVKCFMKQLLSGLEHCHSRGVLHRDIKGSNLLIDNDGILKIADFGLATFYDPKQKQTMTSRVVTLWYRPPELLLGATSYGTGVDLWSAGCIMAELLAGKPVMPGRTEVEQLHKIFKLCGSPSDSYWKKYRLPNATLFKPQHPYKRCVAEAFNGFTPSSVHLVETLLTIDPADRGTSTSALNSEFFTTEPLPCDPSSLPKYPPSKELNVKLRDEELRRQKGLAGKGSGIDGARRIRYRGDRTGRAIPAPEANAESQANLDVRKSSSYPIYTHGHAHKHTIFI
ncbi:Protein kinase superfamily protein [Arabidopsis thaliana]|jgi:serine/threonine protein kinase|uniref:Protein kinase superfamily protein n=1 Tax=Arabidopsis thaliana TaxID=3702 RepID=A0A1P8BGH2_ARATH|nr:Protein kinase superfamily protein [Arabidopsis thaliana]ANM70712.1 Protein kinase superfamily protein [Arabidopsis thaliana]|eukprot:NP_001332298.1 Protein kinase superfamily protein [Arabidopsis thaliana]